MCHYNGMKSFFVGQYRLRRKVEAAFFMTSGPMGGEIPSISWGLAA